MGSALKAGHRVAQQTLDGVTGQLGQVLVLYFLQKSREAGASNAEKLKSNVLGVIQACNHMFPH